MLELLPDDFFLVAYPKSGSTWVRFLVCNYLTNGRCDFLNIFDIIPDLHMSTKFPLKCSKPRILKSHFPYQPEYRNVIYLVRDGRDIAVSYYFHYIKQKKIDKNTSFPKFLDIFNSGSLPFGLWNTHIISWLTQKPEHFLIIKYEDILINPEEQLVKILKHIGLKIIPKRIKIAIDASSFDKMYRLECKQHDLISTLSDSEPDIPFVRKGIFGDYLNYFDKNMEAEFIKIHFEALKHLDYI